jgi:acetyltransferase-like isoleucine patch superfamily enzyme
MYIIKKIYNIYIKGKLLLWKFKHKVVFNKKIEVNKLFFGKNFDFEIDKNAKFEVDSLTVKNYCSIRVKNTGHLVIGENVYFNNSASINCLNSISIGANTLLGEGVRMYDHNHRFRDIEMPISKQGYSLGSIIIGENTWIGSGVTILKNVNIGDNVVIGAGCLIKDDIPSNMIVQLNENSRLLSIRRISNLK